MTDYYHTFHIPVMGTGHSVDTPIRLGHLGISSVISLVDDLLLERIREYYSRKCGLSYTRIPRKEEDGRAKRTTAYLEMVAEIVRVKMQAVKDLPFFEQNDKSRYFELLPEEIPLKQEYLRLIRMETGPERDVFAGKLTDKMWPGSIDVNIMTKLDRVQLDENRQPLGDEFSDAKAALRGYAKSSLKSCIVFSAGINQGLYHYMTQFQDFYRDAKGEIKKKIVLKVSDFRSALIQGKFLAKKGLEIHEFRIESGLNCGGHAFPCNGHLLPSILKEFKEKRELLARELMGLVARYYASMGWKYPESESYTPLVTVQGGIGTNGEARRLREDFGMDMTGWGTPFLLVPEATCVDDPTRELLRRAGNKDVYLSGASPLGIPFNNLHGTGSDLWTQKRAAEGRPGSPCHKGYLVSNTDFSTKPVCLASSRYQRHKLKEIDSDPNTSAVEKQRLRAGIFEKACICDHLGNGALIALGIAEEKNSPQCICPGPNIAWFNRLYTLEEMVDHIYGRGPSLVPKERPHVFAKEIEMYVDYFQTMADQFRGAARELKNLQEFKENLENSLDYCLEIARNEPYRDENLASIPPCVERERSRLRSIYDEVANP
ncbi:MAG: hypothetical protein V1736_05700 [Pseudomonadota bacterium]